MEFSQKIQLQRSDKIPENRLWNFVCKNFRNSGWIYEDVLRNIRETNASWKLGFSKNNSVTSIAENAPILIMKFRLRKFTKFGMNLRKVVLHTLFLIRNQFMRNLGYFAQKQNLQETFFRAHLWYHFSFFEHFSVTFIIFSCWNLIMD